MNAIREARRRTLRRASRKKEEMMIRKAKSDDLETVAALAGLLWPDAELLKEEYSGLLEDPDCAVFLWETEGKAAGFAQAQLRHDYVEGTDTSPVGYLEGIYVREADRSRGIAAALLRACEGWAAGKGCREFASDCELTNEVSQAFHQKMGFTEANRIVCFVKTLQ